MIIAKQIGANDQRDGAHSLCVFHAGHDSHARECVGFGSGCYAVLKSTFLSSLRNIIMFTRLTFTVVVGVAFFAGLFTANVRAAEVDPFDQSDVPLEVDTTDAKATKIILVAGAMSVGSKPRKHEYFAGCALLADMLKKTEGVHPVMVLGGWPKDEKIFEGAKAIVFYMDGGGKQPFVLDKAKGDKITALVKQGVGIVHLHQVIDYPIGPGEMAIAWMGGAYQPKVSARGHWDSTFDNFPEHEITRGVKPFELNDGFLVKMKWTEDVKRVTPLLFTDAKSKVAKPSLDACIAWAYERADGGRSFTYTGIDGHEAWELEGLRKFTVNGILWSAKVAIPKEGASAEFDQTLLNRHFDRKGGAKPAVKPAVKPAAKAKTDK